MAEARSIPQNAALGKIAELLNKAKEMGNKVDLPVIGGLGDLVVGETPSEIENWSYGNYPIQTTEMGLPQIKRERKQSLADTALALAPIAKATEGLPAGLSIKDYHGKPHLDLMDLYHGGDEFIQVLDRRGPYRSVFTSLDKEAASSHGNQVTKFQIDKNKIITGDLDWEKGYDDTKHALDNALTKSPATYYLNDDDLYDAVVYDNPKQYLDNLDIDYLDKIDLAIELQALRADVANKLGYHAVGTRDEHGTSYQVLNAENISKMFGDEYPQIVNRAGSLDELQEKYAGGGSVIKAVKSLAKNLNQDLIEKYLSTGKLSPEEMAKYEKNALKMETPTLQKYNLENANLQGGTPESRAVDLGFIDVFHGSPNPEITEFNLKNIGKNSGNTDRAAIWASTDPQNANGYALNWDAYKSNPDVIELENESNSILRKIAESFDDKPTFNELRKKLNDIHSKKSDLYNRFLSYDIDSFGSNIYPLKIIGGNDFPVVNALGENYAKINNKAIDSAMQNGSNGVVIKNVKDNAGTFSGNADSIATFNPKNIRSRFAAFDPLRKESSSLLAGTALGDLLLKYASPETSSPEKPDNYAQGGAVQYDPAKIDAIIAAIPKFSDDEIKTIMQSS